MIAAGTPAHIVNTVSMAGHVHERRSPAPYTVSKFAALAATECLAHDLAAIGAPIKVSAVVPGAVDTRIGTLEPQPARRRSPATPTDDAAFVEQALADLTRDQGAPPEEVAGMIVDAIRTEQFLVPTKPSYAAAAPRPRRRARSNAQLPPDAQLRLNLRQPEQRRRRSFVAAASGHAARRFGAVDRLDEHAATR